MSARVDILKAVQARIKQRFCTTGYVDPFLRNVWRRPWRPGNTVRPSATVSDGGQRSDEDNPEESADALLKIVITIDLALNWDREAEEDLWSDRVQALIDDLINFIPTTAAGVLRMDYKSDDPLDVLVADGKQESVWIVEIECAYFFETNAR